MPVTFDNIGRSWTSGTTISLSFNFTAAANAVLLVFTGGGADRSVSSVAYGGAALTQLLDVDTGGCQVWGLTAPAAGSNALVTNWVASGANMDGMAIAVSYLNVRSTNPFGTIVGNFSAPCTTLALSLSSTTTDLVVTYAKINGAAMQLQPGTTRLSATMSSSIRFVIMDTTGATALSVSASTNTASSIKMVGVPLFFSATAMTRHLRTLLGVGC